MKRLITVISICFISMVVYSQSDTCLTKTQLIKIATTISDLKIKDSLQTKQIYSLKDVVSKFEILQGYNNEKIELKDRQISLYKESILNLKDVVYATKPKWYETHTATMIFGFVLGGATIYTSSVIISNIK